MIRTFLSSPRFVALATCLLALLLAACEAADPREEIRQRQASGDYAGTLDPLRELLAEDPEDGELNFLYGRALVVTGEIGLATWPLRQALEDEQWREPAAMQLAHVELANGDFNEVVAVTTRILEEDPDHAMALLYRGQAHAYWRKDFEAALADGTRAMEIDPELIEAYEPRILALLGLGRLDEAGELLAESGRRLEEMDAPARVRAWHCSTSAIFTAENGEPERAKESFDACLEKYPTDTTVVSYAVGLADAGQDFERSREILRNAVAEAPGQQFFRIQLANRLRVAEEAAEGEAVLREATEAEDPRVAAGAWLDLAGYRHALGEHAAAADAIERAIDEVSEVDDPGPQLRFQWADALLVSGQLDRAAEVAEEISVPAQRHMILGRVAQERGHPAEALEEFDQALRVWPDNPWARYYTALAAEQVGDFDRALEEYRYAVRISVGATDARTRGARLLIAEGQLQRAYQLLFLDSEKSPLEPAGELLSMYLMARAANPLQLQNAIRALAEHDPARVPAALARGAEGAAEVAGAKSALGLLLTAPGIDYSHPDAAPALRVLVRLAHEAGQPEVAEQVVEAARAAHPEAPVFHEIEGLHLELAGTDPEAARAAYARAVEGDPESPGALMGLGRLSAQADPTRALALFDRAAAADPADPTPKLEAARALLALGRKDEAAQRLSALLVQHPLEGAAAHELLALELEREATSGPRTLDLARRAARFGGGVEEYEQLSEIYARLEQPEMAEKAASHARQLRQALAKAEASEG